MVKKLRYWTRKKFCSLCPQPDHLLSIQLKWTDQIISCPPVKTKFSKQIGGKTESASRFWETTVSNTYDDNYHCKVCVGDRANHDILDNFGGKCIRIVLSDQHVPRVISDTCHFCTVIIGYSNASLEDMLDYIWIPMVKDGLDIVSIDAKGFKDLIKEAMARGLVIHLAVTSGTSLLTVGPAGYTESMTFVYQISQSNLFKLDKGKVTRSQFASLLFPQPALPHVDYKFGPKKLRKMTAQHEFEA